MQILPVWFIFVAAGMRLVGGLAYLRATLAGRARPHAVSWLIWSITPTITFFAELSAGVGYIAIVTLALAINPFLVFVASLLRDRSLLRVNRFDVFCLSIAVFGILLWGITDTPAVAINIAIAADMISALPTIRKTIRQPTSEYPPTYLTSASAMILALLASQSVSFEGFAFPVYILLINLFIASLALRKPKPTKPRAKRHRR